MESILWGLRTTDPLILATPIFLNLIGFFVLYQNEYLFLLIAYLWRVFTNRPQDTFLPRARGERPGGVVIIPSLLRDRDDFGAITTTIESAATNRYPGDLHIITSVDGRTEFPALYAELEAWVARQSYSDSVRVFVTGTETRLGKMMAVEAGVRFMKGLVAAGAWPAFPEIYFSIDGDGTLSEHAIERLADKLSQRNPITGNRHRIVSGKICIRPDLLWQGWRAFFTVKGQLYLQASREFLVSNVSRFNWKIAPRMGVPGALYCTWSEVLLQAPQYMAFMQTLRPIDCLKWWFGVAPPKFTECKAPPLPEALTGASDDTCMAFLATIASWKNDQLTFNAPATPFHALARLFASFFIDRSHHYAPEARVYTYSPPTLKGIWKQRVRWNSSRVECAGRFWRSFWFHWEVGFPVSGQILMLIHTVFEVVIFYVILPYMAFGHPNAVLAFLIGYAAQTFSYGAYTAISLMIEQEYRNCWRVIFSVPLASAYCIVINVFACVYGVTRDILLFGNSTNFAPEWTLIKGRCERVALMFRVRRFFALSLRSVLYGDVPFGAFWFGWRETPWTSSGFHGWTTGKKPRSMLSRRVVDAGQDLQ